MKITKEKLKQIIKEELEEAIRAKHRGGPEAGIDWVDSETGRVVGYSGRDGERMHLGLPGGDGAKEKETPDLFELAEYIRNVADHFDSEKATVLKQAAEILHMESGVFE